MIAAYEGLHSVAPSIKNIKCNPLLPDDGTEILRLRQQLQTWIRRVVASRSTAATPSDTFCSNLFQHFKSLCCQAAVVNFSVSGSLTNFVFELLADLVVYHSVTVLYYVCRCVVLRVFFLSLPGFRPLCFFLFMAVFFALPLCFLVVADGWCFF